MGTNFKKIFFTIKLLKMTNQISSNGARHLSQIKNQ